MTQNNTKLGILLMIATTFVFAMQDGISRHLAETYNVVMVVMVRYWFFLAFVLAISMRHRGGLQRVAQTRQMWVQLFRGVLLAGEILVTVLAFVYLGLIETQAIFAIYPLLIAALSGPVLGEGVGWRRWVAIGIGFLGMLVILQPGFKVFSPYAVIPLVGAFMFAAYSLLTRYVARQDTAATSFFYTGVGGAAVMTLVGPFFWENMSAPDWGWMALLCVMGATGHYLLIKTYEAAEASAVQPFAYLQVVFVTILAMVVFDEVLPLTTAIGGGIIIVAGIYTLWRERLSDSS